ncbi:MAG: hypothetical protein KDA69_01490 [Planctomycetaceae bacterium]|nr:hypothetical protein [Planctomycetaceae bacterium]MCA9042960.1 hypothetical protein [Planctomycetaceae bacterium]MCB9953520.1 VWA domain-containing protein [Planctomycetaceae bacterium]
MAKITRTVRPLADVNVLKQPDGSLEVVACIMPKVEDLVGEGESRVCLALDASRSIKEMYGEEGDVFSEPKPNYVEKVARKLGSILTEASKSGTVPMLYWALGQGDETEMIGEFDEDGCDTAPITGPKKKKWGKGTHLLPVLKHIVDEVDKDSEWTLAVIITDGFIQDEEDSKNYCMELGKKLVKQYEDGTRAKDTLKFVLIGVGQEVDADQLESFDDMFEGTDLAEEVDLFSSGIAAHMKDQDDILGAVFGELMTEDKIVAPNATILDDKGQEVKNYSDGLPGKFRFRLPAGCKSFTVHTPRADVTQDISEVVP